MSLHCISPFGLRLSSVPFLLLFGDHMTLCMQMMDHLGGEVLGG